MDQIERLALEKMFDKRAGEPPVLRIYAHNVETGTHQMIFMDRIIDWEVELDETDWYLNLKTPEYDFGCSPGNMAELKVRLKPSIQVWLRSQDNEYVAEIFRWTEFNKVPFSAFIPDVWREMQGG